MVGISETSDEADYTSHPLYPPEFPVPKVKSSIKGEPFEEVADFDREIRPFMDEKITERTLDIPRIRSGPAARWHPPRWSRIGRLPAAPRVPQRGRAGPGAG